MTKARPTVSVIIPAYNEENRIYDCLTAITNQSVKPIEIIVVNNNSSDETAVIAKRFKHVTILKEQKQGLIAARNKGFSVARGDILARIDADTIVGFDWIEQVQNAFIKDASLAGVTGHGRTRSGVNSQVLSDICSRAYYVHAQAILGTKMLWGANMAISKAAWLQIQSLVCHDDILVHEDQDISLALHSKGLKISLLNELLVSVDFNDVQYFDKFWSYYLRQFSTRKFHFTNRVISQESLAHFAYRILLYVATLPVLISFLTFTMVNSSLRYLVSSLKQSSLYWRYKNFFSDFYN